MPLNFNAPELDGWRSVWTSPESSGGRSFETWLLDHIRDAKDKGAAQILADQLENQEITDADKPYVQVITSVLPDLYEAVGGDGEVMPLEQGLLKQALPAITSDIAADEQRRKVADQLGQNVLAGTNAANEILGRTQGAGFDAQTYMQQNADVQQVFNSLAKDEQGLAILPDGQHMTPAQFAQYHYQKFGNAEGRRAQLTNSLQLNSDYANADRTTNANIAASNEAAAANVAALGQATAEMQQNLRGALAEKANAIQIQLQTLYQNLGELDGTRKKALTDQIAAMQGNLAESIAAQRQALTDQLASLGTAAGAQADAQRAALQTEIQGLTAAQAPLAAARTKAAELQATAVNVGLERTKDQLTADNARAGYIGGSTAQDATLARATIDARQRAAEALGGANVANASDMRDIGVRGATGGRTIADALSQAQRDIAVQGANGTAGLTVAGATGKQALADSGATGLASIQNDTGVAKAGIGALGANSIYANTAAGADQSRGIADQLAQGTYGLKATGVNNTLAAKQQGNAAKATYYDNDYNRSISAALAMPQIAGATASTLTGLDNYATSGLNRAQGLLGWWSQNPTTAPTPGAVAVQPGNTGNAIAGIGAGLVGAGLNIGQANGWWQGAGKTTPSITAPASANIGSNPALPGDWHSTGT